MAISHNFFQEFLSYFKNSSGNDTRTYLRWSSWHFSKIFFKNFFRIFPKELGWKFFLFIFFQKWQKTTSSFENFIGNSFWKLPYNLSEMPSYLPRNSFENSYQSTSSSSPSRISHKIFRELLRKYSRGIYRNNSASPKNITSNSRTPEIFVEFIEFHVNFLWELPCEVFQKKYVESSFWYHWKFIRKFIK